jgi:hypothetical protein
MPYFEKSKGFNLKSGNKPEFKNIGSSPVKQTIDPLEYGRLDDAMEFGREYKAKQADKANKDFLRTAKERARQRVKNEGFRRDLGKHHWKHTTGPEATRPPKAAIVKKSAKKTGKQILKKVASKLLGPIGVAATAYEVGKTIPKVTKATQKGLKKRAKTGKVNIGRKL